MSARPILSGKAVFAALILTFPVASPPAALAQGVVINEDYKIMPENPQTGMWAGYSVDIDEWVAVIGGPSDVDHHDAETAFISRYNGETWVEEQVLEPLDPGWKEFGAATAIAGDVVVVGAPRDDERDTAAGAVYVYRFNDAEQRFVQEAKLIGQYVERYNSFGSSLAISEDGQTIVVGSPRSYYPGRVHIYRFDADSQTWIEAAMLEASDGGNLGIDVGISGDVVVTGASPSDIPSAYVFRYDRQAEQWNEEAILTGSDAAPNGKFGYRVGVDEDLIAVADIYHSHDFAHAGAVYVFRYDPESGQWNETAEIRPFDADIYEYFGKGLDLEGDQLVVCAYQDHDPYIRGGAAYLFTHVDGTWEERFKLAPSDGRSENQWGHAAAIDASNILIGAPYDDEAYGNCGAVYVFDLDGPGFGDLELLRPVPGLAGEINEWSITGGTPAETAVFVYGFQPGLFQVRPCPGVYLDMSDPRVFGRAMVEDASGEAGTARLVQYVPRVASGHTLFFQVIEDSTCRVSNLVEHTFP